MLNRTVSLDPGKAGTYTYGIALDSKPTPETIENFNDVFKTEGSFTLFSEGDDGYLKDEETISFDLKSLKK